MVSADQVGKFPDSNIGDALKRISGINVQYDQGEARFGQVRGTSADMIQTIEVNKVVTPDMDADAIGGSINLVTKNSPYKRFISATAGTGYNWISDKAQLNLGLLMVTVSSTTNWSYAFRFLPELAFRFGDVEFVWDKDVETGELCITDYQVRQYYVTRERQSYSAALDWDINENNKLTFKGIFNNRNDWENRYRLTVKGINLEEDDNGNEYCSINNKGTMRVQTKGGTPDNRNARLERQPPWTLPSAVSISSANWIQDGVLTTPKPAKNVPTNVTSTIS